MVFMDIGCGDGFFTIPAAKIVGTSGKVYAVDIDASAIDSLKGEAAKSGLENVEAEVGEAEEKVFCEKCADVVFYSMVLHDFREPTRVLHNAKLMVKPGGKLVNLDWKKKRTLFGPPVRIRFSEQQALDLIEGEGFEVEKVKDSGPNHYVITARPQIQGSASA
jgi:ubiquinone/menaquinone biosynthesis C-methylase UbiE